MNCKKTIFIWKAAVIGIACGLLGPAFATAQIDGEATGMEILTRGPVHEAFAETVMFDPTPGIIVDVEPPDLIEEILPDQRPSGDNVVWIPGYWAWDEDENDFLWISGIWRNIPPNREWIPGYWAPLGAGYQWTSGYWEDEQATQVSYLPEPPRSVEAGPNIPASSDDQTWIPGNWQYQEDRYAWSAGYWVDARPNWSWTPACYRWTPRGYLYVNGYWDYPVASRGVVFAPVRFQRSYISQPGFFYAPSAVISLSVFTNHLFLRPSYCHYYFGDYYAPVYRDRYYPSYSCYGGRRGYDPIFAYNRWENRHDRNWVRERQNYYEHRRDNVGARPPRTWAALNSRSVRDRVRGDYGVAARYNDVVRNGGGGRQGYQQVSNSERQRFTSQKQDLRTYGRERQKREYLNAPTRDVRPDSRDVSRQQVGRSPVGGRGPNDAKTIAGTPPRLTDGKSSKGVASNSFPETRKVMGTRPQIGQNAPKTSSNNAVPSGGRSTAESMRTATRETRTLPGQRREATPSSKSKAVASTQSGTSSGSGSRSNVTPNRPSSSLPPGMSKASSRSSLADTKSQFLGKPYTKSAPAAKPPAKSASLPHRNAGATSPRQSATTPQRNAAPSLPKNTYSTQQRNAAPTVQRSKTYSAPPRQVAPVPQRKSYSPPPRQAVPTPQRKSYSPPPRQAVPTPQRKSYSPPQRQAAPVPQRKSYSPPQRQAAPAPQRKSYSPPQRQASPQPQRQASPQPQRQSYSSQQRQSAQPSSRGTTRTEQSRGNSSSRGKSK